MAEFVTVETLSTLAGMAGVVGLIVQYTKSIVKKRFPDWGVRVYALVLSWLTSAYYAYLTNSLTPENAGLVVFNGFVVAVTAIGGHKIITDPKADKDKKM